MWVRFPPLLPNLIRTVCSKLFDSERLLSYNRRLLDIVEHTSVVRRTVLDPHVGTQRQTGEARFVECVQQCQEFGGIASLE